MAEIHPFVRLQASDVLSFFPNVDDSPRESLNMKEDMLLVTNAVEEIGIQFSTKRPLSIHNPHEEEANEEQVLK